MNVPFGNPFGVHQVGAMMTTRIAESSPTRLVVKLGSRWTNSASCTLDKAAGTARFERTLFFFTRKPIEVPIGDIAAMDILRQSTSTQPGNPFGLTQETYYPRVYLRSGRMFYLSQAGSEEETIELVRQMLAFLGLA
jgi:hypothetical protein